jgi:HAD superfamily hydrolase (TIGR01549 family)
MKMIRGVFFDVDDTLFDRELAQRKVLQIIVERYSELFEGIHEERVLSAFLTSDRISNDEYVAGLPGKEIRSRRTEIFLGLLRLSRHRAKEITDLYVNEYPTLNAPVPGAKELVSNLASKYTLGVISNGLPDVQYKKLGALGVDSEFACIVLSEVLGIAKPDPQIFHHALSLLSMSPNEVLYIGDSFENDVMGAIGVGMPVCWFNPTGIKPKHPDIYPTYEIKELSMVECLLATDSD